MLCKTTMPLLIFLKLWIRNYFHGLEISFSWLGNPIFMAWKFDFHGSEIRFSWLGIFSGTYLFGKYTGRTLAPM